MQPVFRFAPSPDGYLHLGPALSAGMNLDMARAQGGRLLLRIEAASVPPTIPPPVARCESRSNVAAARSK
jgi:glutamyl-Q tRNA(Asp) synthetase